MLLLCDLSPLSSSTLLPGSNRELGSVIAKKKQGCWLRRPAFYPTRGPRAGRLALRSLSVSFVTYDHLTSSATARLTAPHPALGVSPLPSRGRWADVPFTFPFGLGKT